MFIIFSDFQRFSGFRLRDESWDCHRFCHRFCHTFCSTFGPGFWGRYAPHFAPYSNKASHPRKTTIKITSSNTLPAKIAAILTLRSVCAHKSSQSLPYAYLSRRLCFKIVEIPSLRGRSKFLHAQHSVHARLLNFRRTKIFDMRLEKF